MTRSNVPSSSQTAIRSTATPRRTVDVDRSSRATTTRDLTRSDRNWRDGDRDRDRNRDRDWDDGRRYRRPPVDIYRNWDRGRVYSWNNNRYRWYGGTWVIYDSPSVVYTESLPVVGANVVADVQAELRREGYYRGAVDGVLGPRTRDAIAEFQDDHGLAVTGRITTSLLRELDLS